MKYLFLLLFLVGCGQKQQKYHFGDCVLISSSHFFGGHVFKLVDMTHDSYMGHHVDDRFVIEHFDEDEIKQSVNCPMEL